MKLLNWFKRKPEPMLAPARMEPVVQAKERRKMPRFSVSSSEELQALAEKLFKPYQPPKGVRGDGQAGLAMDNGLSAYMGANYSIVSNFIADGLNFKGYPDLAAMMLRAEFRKPVETIAKEATREWIKFRSTDTKKDSDDTSVADKIRALEKEFLRLRVRDVVRRQITHGLAYGLGHIWIGIKGRALDSPGRICRSGSTRTDWPKARLTGW